MLRALLGGYKDEQNKGVEMEMEWRVVREGDKVCDGEVKCATGTQRRVGIGVRRGCRMSRNSSLREREHH